MGKKSAFSLLELIVVMAIAAILMSLGLTSLISLRNTTLIKQSVTEFTENINGVRNSARNTVISGRPVGVSPAAEEETINAVNNLDYFAIKFENNNYQQGTCSSTSTQLICTFSAVNMLKPNPANVIVNPEAEGCGAIIFSLSTGNFRFANLAQEVATFNNTKKCNYSFRNGETGGTTIRVEGDVELNKFRIL